MRSMSPLVKDHLKSPPLARAKEKRKCGYLCNMDNRRSLFPRRSAWKEKNDPENKRERGTPTGKTSRIGKTSQHVWLVKKGDSPEGKCL